MPRYFFNIRDHVRDDDHEGVDLAGPEEAGIVAIRFAGDYVSNDPSLLRGGQRFIVDTLDDTGKVLLHVEIRATKPDGNVSQTTAST